jgi:hypothetical protein
MVGLNNPFAAIASGGQSMNIKRERLSLAVGISLLLFCLPTFAQSGWRPYPLSSYDAIGSWFGRAVPKPGATICPVGVEGCPVPKEIVMVFTINQDGTFIGIDSNIFAGGTHSTAHGQWTAVWPYTVNATFTLLQSSPATPTSPSVFIGGFKNLFQADMVDHDTMTGQIDAYLYSYTDSTGAAIVDSDGLPTPSPLSPPAQCSTTPGCTHMGIFTFKARRVNVQ